MNLFKHLFSRHPHQETVTAPDSCAWPGESGTEYAGQNEAGGWVPVYISQTRDLHQRLEGHVRTSDAVAKGATHLHAHYCAAGQATRCGEERDLIKQWQPVCNEVLES